MTGVIVMSIVVGLFALCGLAFVGAVLYVAPILFVPLGLIALVVAFFYFWTPSKRHSSALPRDKGAEVQGSGEAAARDAERVDPL
jgi:hypothetical protein